MKKKILFFTVLALAAVFAVILILPLVLPKEDIADADIKNTEIYYGLLGLGIEDAVVDATEERIIIRYNNAENVKTENISKICASAFPESKKIIIQKFVNFEFKEQTEIKMSDAIG